ncbi:MFS transporter (plasmid) [Burkholderia sp. SFA1]|uniref:MFS transporter n=1 Tax=unclassified Caballeronia TaxID=2646786 RepID=UPI001F487D62|nr:MULTISPECIES: MFS transporter [unclassified Caballeronia]MCE4545894.1 MFS transporter [Caballeronia sp. PC1]MCE4571984.1 MFS transporter [Caballeronia sp. CLC5]BBQ01248.1 MFS transporter [Burkholderia sp. SFA1]
MNTPQQPIDIAAVIDAAPLSRLQLRILTMVGLTVLIDGFDVQSMGFVAPAIIHAWGADKAAFGIVFGAGLLGMLIGSLVLSVVADKIGRRPVLIGATFAFGLCMLATTQVTTITGLLVLRFVTGLGLGAIMPNAMALAAEFSPKRRRVTLMMWVSCGFTLGAVLGGLISAALIPVWGWQSVFVVGGVVPIALSAMMAFYMPESMLFSVVRGTGLVRVADTLRRIDPASAATPESQYVVPEARPKSAPVAELFRSGRAKTTLLLWGVNFMNLLNLYFLSNWLPTIAKDLGLSTSTAVLVGTTLQLGGVAGTLAMGPVIDRIGFYKVLIPALFVATFAIAAIGQTGLPLPMLFVVVGITGFSIIGGQPAINALAATWYPTLLRSTGVGWSLGVGRLGSIIGPVIGGELMRMNWSNDSLFLAVAIPAIVSAGMLVLMASARNGVPSSVTQC